MDISADCFKNIAHSDTHSFTQLVLDYLAQSDSLQPFYQFEPNLEGINAAIANRQFPIENRKVLVDVLQAQYQDLQQIPLVNNHIEALLQPTTFSVVTAHQPNLLGGPLYFIYKILHTVRLAEYLKDANQHQHFVPIFYIGSEDNDLDELGHFFFYGNTYKWNTTQKGAVGRMSTEDLQPLLQELFVKMGPPGVHLETLKELILRAFSKENTIARATQIFVHELLGAYGVVILNPDDARLKSLYIPIMQDDLLYHSAASIVTETSQRLSQQYQSQAFVRDINLFYLNNEVRERIEKEGALWKVNNTEIQFTEDALLKELHTHPERFSPNVILRGMYQETILPNVAFVGGGGELAYWMQLKDLFSHYKVDFPTLILRQSFLLLNPATQINIQKTNLPTSVIFQPVDAVIKKVAIENNHSILLEQETKSINEVLLDIQNKATALDASLKDSGAAVIAKIQHQLDVLSKKMIRAEKRKYETLEERLTTINKQLYPNGVMQERKQSFMDYYLNMGASFFEMLLQGTHPFGKQFVLVDLSE